MLSKESESELNFIFLLGVGGGGIRKNDFLEGMETFVDI